MPGRMPFQIIIGVVIAVGIAACIALAVVLVMVRKRRIKRMQQQRYAAPVGIDMPPMYSDGYGPPHGPPMPMYGAPMPLPPPGYGPGMPPSLHGCMLNVHATNSAREKLRRHLTLHCLCSMCTWWVHGAVLLSWPQRSAHACLHAPAPASPRLAW